MIKNIKIKNINAAELLEVDKGIRTSFSHTKGVLADSLFLRYMIKNGLKYNKRNMSKDVISVKFNFGTNDYEAELMSIKKLLKIDLRKVGVDKTLPKTTRLELAIEETLSSTHDDSNKKRYHKIKVNKDKYEKISQEDIRVMFYNEGIKIDYKYRKAGKDEINTINYKMLCRTPSKAKEGSVIFVNSKLYDTAINWLSMGLYNKMPRDNAKIVELSAYMTLTISGIEDVVHIPVENILILQDQDSLYNALAKVVLYDEVQEKCVVNTVDNYPIKSTLWDGMALIEEEVLPNWCNGMALLRNHFFKACAFKSRLQLFFRDWCLKNGFDYETHTVTDMFGNVILLKDIKMITTNNAIKWLKFKDLMGDNPYQYWCNIVNTDNSLFGIVKTDHESKLEDVQQMSYQMINTLFCTDQETMDNIARETCDYIYSLKVDDAVFKEYLIKNQTTVNHYEMLAQLMNVKNFTESEYFRKERTRIISDYVARVRYGKVINNGDNITVCGNPYALLLHTVGEDWSTDTTLKTEEGAIQCYTTRFDNDEYLCGFRSPHNSPNNIIHFHNVYSDIMERYFPFSDNIMAVNCIGSNLQERANGCDFDSDAFYVTNQKDLVESARYCYTNYPTIVNGFVPEEKCYPFTMDAFAKMDNGLAASQDCIGESSNLAQKAMSLYWDALLNQSCDFKENLAELEDYVCILSVLAQLSIDSAKRTFNVDPTKEVEKIKKDKIMIKSKPKFMRYIPVKSKFKKKKSKEIRKKKSTQYSVYKCPMEMLLTSLGNIDRNDNIEHIPNNEFIKVVKGKGTTNQYETILRLIKDIDDFVKEYKDENSKGMTIEEYTEELENKQLNCISKIKHKKMTVKTMNRLIYLALCCKDSKEAHYKRKILNILYQSNPERFLSNFQDVEIVLENDRIVEKDIA